VVHRHRRICNKVTDLARQVNPGKRNLAVEWDRGRAHRDLHPTSTDALVFSLTRIQLQSCEGSDAEIQLRSHYNTVNNAQQYIPSHEHISRPLLGGMALRQHGWRNEMKRRRECPLVMYHAWLSFTIKRSRCFVFSAY
jgi:hypothetical protein